MVEKQVLPVKDKKKGRLILISLMGATIVLIGLATVFRELPGWLSRVNGPAVIVSQQFLSQHSPTPVPSMVRERNEVEEMLKPLRGLYGIYYLDLSTGNSFAINGDRIFTAASLIKLPVMLTLYKEADAGRIDLDTVYKLRGVDKRGGAGSLQYKPDGYSITYRQMAQLMGSQSDNTAFNVISKLLGETKIQNTIDLLGMKNTSFANNDTTPEDINLFFQKLYNGKVVTEKSKEEILDFLTDTIWEDRIPAGIPQDIKVAHKIGTEVRVISDAGIVFTPRPFILTILSQEVNEIEAKQALLEIAKKIYDLHTIHD
ncbi:MAG: serine hydrolase [Patescibacteria group bacterium]|jgi:beta-lactamase class A